MADTPCVVTDPPREFGERAPPEVDLRDPDVIAVEGIPRGLAQLNAQIERHVMGGGSGLERDR